MNRQERITIKLNHQEKKQILNDKPIGLDDGPYIRAVLLEITSPERKGLWKRFKDCINEGIDFTEAKRILSDMNTEKEHV